MKSRGRSPQCGGPYLMGEGTVKGSRSGAMHCCADPELANLSK